MAKKASPSVKGLVFGGGWVASRNLSVIPSESPELMEKGTEHTKLLFYAKEKWTHHKVAWGSTAVTGRIEPELEALVLGVDGEVLRAQTTGFSEESVEGAAKLPGPMRDIRFIGKKAFAVGMGRTAFRREKPGQWPRIDEKLRSKKGEIRGLNSVDGFSENDVIAVGLEGEIWHYDGKAWESVDSPTNVALQRVLCVAPKQVFIAGMAGTILRRNGERFEAVEQDAATENLYGLAWFKGRLYIAGKKLYRLEGDDVQEVDIGLGEGVTFGQLDANDGVLWSFGPKHLAFTADGDKWTQVMCT